MGEDSSAAPIWGAFEHLLARAIFLDELGPEDNHLWQSLLVMSGRAYSAYQDHLLGRKTPEGDYAPFWDNIHTEDQVDRKSTRLNSSHVRTSYAVFCSKKKQRPN